jgi:hypothetical protein
MASNYVQNLGSAVDAGSGTTLTITLADNVLDGDTIVVRVATGYTTDPPTITAKENTYTFTRTSVPSGGAARFTTFIFQAPDMDVGDTIVITSEAATSRVAVVDQYTGLLDVSGDVEINFQGFYSGVGAGIGNNVTATMTTTTALTALIECVYSIEPSTHDHAFPTPDWQEVGRDGTTGATPNLTVSGCTKSVDEVGDYEASVQLQTGVVFHFHLFALTVAQEESELEFIGDLEQVFIEESPARLWPSNPDSVFGMLRKTLVDPLQQGADTFAQLFVELFFNTTTVYFPRWEDQVGIPASRAMQSIENRRVWLENRGLRAPFTRTRRRKLIEQAIRETFGPAVMLTPAGVPLLEAGVPLYSGEYSLEGLYRIDEQVEEFHYKVYIKYDIDVDADALPRELAWMTPAGISFEIIRYEGEPP